MNKHVIAALLFTCILPITAFAGEQEDDLIAKITETYGGDALLNISNYRIEDHFLSPTTGQSHTPSLTEIGNSSQVLLVDIENNNAVFDTWGSGRSGGFQGSTVSDGTKAHTVNYQAKTYGDAANADPHVFAGGTMRTSDAILVYELNKAKESAEISGDASYLNRPHIMLSMPFPSSAELTLYIDAKTFLVSKMVREIPQFGNLDYVYSNYKQNNGITYASSINFFVTGAPNIISKSREISFNVEIPGGIFDLPEGFVKEGVRIDTSEMRVNKISNRVYHIGQGNAYSLFIDTNIGVVAAGGYAALTARYNRFQSESNSYKPLAYQVATHHHTDHLGGMAEAVSLGAKLVTVTDNIEAIKAATTPTPEDVNFYSIGGRATFGEGRNRVEVYEVSTLHAASFLVTYVPAEKIIFIADHMGTPFADSTPVANPNTVDMLKALDSLNIDIKQIATAHNARIFSMQDMRNSVSAYKPSVCSGNRPVCK